MKKDKKGINIGITFYWGGTYNSIWSNGAGQNMFFLKQCLECIDYVNEVYFVYWNADIKQWHQIIEHEDIAVSMYDWQDVINTTDILIEGTLTLETKYEYEFRKHNTKIISYRMGNDFMSVMEAFVNGKDGGRAFNGCTYDAVWVLPHHMNMNYSYLSIMLDAPIMEVPYIWSPVFLERAIDYLEVRQTYGYRPSGKHTKRVSVLEPNISVLKNCLLPVLIAENAYHRLGEALEHVYLCNTYDKKDLTGFFNFIGYTQLVKNNIMTVEKRFITPYFLATYTDIMLSFQWENGLNNIYMEALYGNYPLVHNSPFLRKAGVGFYYDQFNAYEGAEALIHAMNSYDKEFSYYAACNHKFIQTLSPTFISNIQTYRHLLDSVCNS